ncbi:hypothetical protein JZ751_014454 [Albula glossodonta]|uniref:LITAF domain-containing protein n=1 Tax=Albula glossodonta TaxID=121402 RepID=A0A8T2MQK9_9TELE|nr:hypothetical protein JZ751_004563 [Albula glossodonta]KAG9332883.1 hypothetical protein JZ751_014454 [Albula glossodonta]
MTLGGEDEKAAAATPPPYLTPGQQTTGQGDVRVYHVHTPFTPPPTTITDNPYHVQTTHTKYVVPGSGLALAGQKQKYVSYESNLGRNPGMTTCTSCQAQVMTNVTYKVGTYAWLMCILLILCGFIIGCCLIPFFMKFFKDAYHTCPRCNRVLHVEKKKCC